MLSKCLCLLIILLSSQIAYAVPIGINDFSGGATLIDFNNIASGESITNQFSALGVTFTGTPFQGDPFPSSTINGTMSAANHLPINNPITALFNNVQNRVGMFFGTSPDSNTTVQISAFLGGNLIEVQTFESIDGNFQPNGNLPSVFSGIYLAGGFDRIEFSSLSLDINAAFQIDDFRFESSSTPVPEPGTLLLLGIGLTGVIGLRKIVKK